MSGVRVQRRAERSATPWKNGGGVTRAIAVWPPAAGLADFAWRVSLAEVSAPGPFSIFPGVDRVLAMVDGAMALTVADQRPIVLTPATAPHAFAGDAAAHGEPLDGVAQDLNVMTRRGVAAAELSWRSVSTETAFDAGTDMLILLALGELATSSAAGALTLSRLDAMIIDGGAAVRVAPKDATAELYLVRLRAGSA